MPGLLLPTTSPVRPSYKSGFARSAAESAYPGLWDGIYAAHVPELGPQPLNLAEVTGRRGFDMNGTVKSLPTTTTTAVKPNADGTGATQYTITGGPSTRYGAINNGTASPDDTDYINNLFSEGDPDDIAYFGFEDMPVDFDTATGVTVKVRQRAAYYESVDDVKYQIFESDESTPLTDEITLECDGEEIYASTVTFRTDTLNFTVTGATTKAAWDGAVIKVIHGELWGGDDPNYTISEIEMTVTYTSSTAPILTRVDGRFCIQLDDDYIDLPYELPAVSPITVLCWCRPTDFTTGQELAVGTAHPKRCYLGKQGSNYFLRLYGHSGYTEAGTANKWVLLGVTVDPDAIGRYWVDGVEKSSVDLGTLATFSNKFNIGSYKDGHDSLWTGEVSSVYVWSRSLRADEIRQIYRDPLAPFRQRRLTPTFSEAAAAIRRIFLIS